MKHTTIVVAIGLALGVELPAAPANALNTRSFVSPTGSDSNTCNLAAPCRNLQAALAQTAPGGEIAILGTAGYSGGATVTITQAVSIVNPGAFEAGIVPPSGGIGITINAGVSDAVSLRGLTIEGAGVGLTGIKFNTGQSLTVENCVIRHVNADGIDFAPNASSSLTVSNTLAADNGNDGIFVLPTGSGAVTAVFNRVQINNNAFHGIILDGELSTGTVKGTVYDSVVAGNAGGIGFFASTSSGHAPTTLMVFNSVSANNLIGLDSQGTGATLRVAHSMVTGNGNGWFAVSSGVVLSAGDNTIEGNTGAEAAPGTYATK